MRYLLFVLFLYATFGLQAQSHISGYVFEIDNQKDTIPIPGAKLWWKGTSKATLTDSKGHFFIEKLDSSVLMVSAMSFKSDSLLVHENNEELRFYLSNIKSLTEVQVIEKTNATEFSSLTVMKIETLGRKELMKAACCNLSESFETNPSVDVNFADAISGTKQIQMLGLSGNYSLITKENMPFLRGLSSVYGLSFIPGTWINSIQLSKGAGSVINGYESFTGQINTELLKPENSEKLLFNAYVNANARNEYNLTLARRLTDVWSVGALLHGSLNPLQQDMNRDGFIDIPTGSQVNGLIRANYQAKTNWEGQLGISYLKDDRFGGQMRSNQKPNDDTTGLYALGIGSENLHVFAKNGYVFTKRPETSMGLQLSYTQHRQNNFYGIRRFFGEESIFYANYIFQSFFINTNHKFKTGISFQHDKQSERFDGFQFKREENVPGIFYEYNFNHNNKLNLTAGGRADYHNYYGLFFTPRLHLRYELTDGLIFRVSAGRALRTANILAENSFLMASSRKFELIPSDYALPYGLKPEIGWNYGTNITWKFKLDYRPAFLTLDVYRTDFVNQVIIDVDSNAQSVYIYNLNGKSFSNTAQIEFGWEFLKRFTMRTAYRYVDTKSSFFRGLWERPMISKHRAFINLAYETRNEHWLFDGTLSWNGSKRMPYTADNPHAYHVSVRSPDYYLLNAQITYVYRWRNLNRFDFYLGIENALNVMQMHPILSAEKPFAKYFDATMVWGPVYGRMLYGGIRYSIK